MQHYDNTLIISTTGVQIEDIQKLCRHLNKNKWIYKKADKIVTTEQ